MNLSKKQEKAIDIARRVMSAALSSGIDSDEDGSISELQAKEHAKNET